jgi:S-adenosylmethionine decarboxylase
LIVPDSGTEWIIDAAGCPPERLAEIAPLRACCEELIEAMRLQVIGQPQWRRFPEPGGVTGLYLLSESHLTVHTFPEYGLVALNVYCCRPHEAPDWDAILSRQLGATAVTVRELTRGRGVVRDEAGNLHEAAR